MEQGDEFLLQFTAHVDHQVAATDEIELGKGRILDNVLLRKN